MKQGYRDEQEEQEPPEYCMKNWVWAEESSAKRKAPQPNNIWKWERRCFVWQRETRYSRGGFKSFDITNNKAPESQQRERWRTEHSYERQAIWWRSTKRSWEARIDDVSYTRAYIHYIYSCSSLYRSTHIQRRNKKRAHGDRCRPEDVGTRPGLIIHCHEDYDWLLYGVISHCN